MNVVIIKMSNGDELVAEHDVLASTSKTTIVNKAKKIFLDGTRGGFMPYFVSAPDAVGVGIYREHMIAMFEAPKDLADSYIKSVSNIQLLS